MNRFRNMLVRALLLAVVAVLSPGSSPSANGADPIRVLFLGDSGPHQPKTRFAELQPVLSDRGIEMTYTDKLSDVNLANLKSYDALVLYANIDVIDRESADALVRYVKAGGGFVPLHCASFCFRNVPELVALMGGQFLRHGASIFRAEDAGSNHELMNGYGGFKSWDETYVHHLHNAKDRTVLEYRVDAEGREPWTWVRTEAKGRIFYTAWGHDGRTWLNPGFQNLVERGIRWAVKRDPQEAGEYVADIPFPTPKMTSIPKGLKPFEYADVGAQIPNYTPSNQWGVQGELLTHVLDPSRSVEGNFRAYSVLTADGVVINGMLASESKTAIELFDAEGKKKSILRDDIEQFVMSTKSIMPEGFEKTMKPEELTDLLEFLTQRGQFVPIDLRKVATLPSDRSLFSDPNNQAEKLIFDSWAPVTFAGIPIQLIDPSNGTVANTIVLHSPNGEILRKMPRSVDVPFNGQIKTLHLLSGVGGWAHPYGNKDAVALTIRFHFEDGSIDDQDLRNGQEFADFIRRVDVPKSQFAFDLRGRQIRYLAVSPKKSGLITKIELRKGNDVSAPVVMAVTAETAGSTH